MTITSDIPAEDIAVHSQLLHRLRNWLRGPLWLHTTIVRNEPQSNLNFHKHVVFFGIPRIMEKRELTIWLEVNVIRFLGNMVRHIQKTGLMFVLGPICEECGEGVVWRKECDRKDKRA